jgi:tellurite resistance-related uncharacterized protein
VSNAQLPPGAELVRTTSTFTESSVPAGLLRAHRVADGVWARLVVAEGCVRFVFEDEPYDRRVVQAGDAFVIPPGRPHRVDIDGPVAFALEFYRTTSDPPAPGTESTGLADDA